MQRQENLLLHCKTAVSYDCLMHNPKSVIHSYITAITPAYENYRRQSRNHAEYKMLYFSADDDGVREIMYIFACMFRS